MRRLRVLTLLDSPITGGAERLAVQLALGLDRERFEPSICSTRPWPPSALLPELEDAGVPILRLDRSSKLDLAPIARLYRHLRSERIDVVHAHMFGSNVWGVAVGRAARVPAVVAHEHSWSYVGDPLRRLLDRELIARFASAFVAVSEDDRRLMQEVEKIDPARVTVISNGIATPVAERDLRADLSIPADAPVAGIVSMIRPEKTLEVLVEAAALARRELPGLRVLVAGSGDPPEQEQRLRAEIARHGVEDVVTLLGVRKDVGTVLAALDVATICSDREGLPLAVMEYMAAGKPVVGTNVGGIPELVDDGVNGLLVPPRDPQAFADALVRLLRDPGLRARMGEAGRERQQREFSLASMIRRFEELYEELVRGRL